MATYNELFSLRLDDELRNRSAVAVTISAEALLAGTPTDEENTWADEVLANPSTEGDKALVYVLATNKDADPAQIIGVADSALQSQVDTLVPSLVKANADANLLQIAIGTGV